MKRSTNYYFAGKISQGGWRHDIIGGKYGGSDLRNAVGVDETDWILDPNVVESEKWPILPLPNGVGNYVGPFFVCCDHGCYHGDRQHGNGTDGGGCYSDGTDRVIRQGVIHDLCLWTIANRTDTLFAWIDSDDAYGTLSEIAFAAAHKKTIWIATNKVNPELWFVYSFAHSFQVAETPLSAWKAFHSPGFAHICYSTYCDWLAAAGRGPTGRQVAGGRGVAAVQPVDWENESHKTGDDSFRDIFGE